MHRPRAAQTEGQGEAMSMKDIEEWLTVGLMAVAALGALSLVTALLVALWREVLS
jgi:hypothetical protein